MNILIKNVMLLSMNEDREIFESTNIHIKEGRINYIGNSIDNLEYSRLIDGKNMLAMPGLINAHTHVGMSLLRNYADDVALHVWLEEKIWPVEAKLTEEDVYWGSLLSIVEMIKTGTTNFCDMYFFMDEVGRAVEESGIRGCLTRGMTVMDMNEADEKLNDTRKLYENWNDRANGRIKVMVAPHAPYTCSTAFLEKSVELAKELNTGIHIHLSETEKEVKDSLDEFNMSPIKRMDEIGLFDVHTIGAHCVHVDSGDIEIIKERNVYPVYNPVSNLKLASGFTPVDEMLKAGINIALGTDGSSSNNNLNLFEEIKIAAIVNKAVNKEATSVSAYEALEMATINGAKALGLDDDIGSIEVGKKADIILIDMDKPHLYPRHDIVSALAYSVEGSDVDTVIVDGNIIMENRIIKTLDEEEIKYMAEKSAKDLIRR